MKTATLALIALTVALVAGCQTVPKTIPTTLTPAEYFQDAQQAASAHNNYDAALVYYETFVKRYPDDKGRIAEAQYEIAFLHYKKGELVKAKAEFQQLIDVYKQPNADTLPRWPLVLANKLIVTIDNALKKRSGKSKQT